MSRSRPSRPLRVLVVHNRYRGAGGEDAVVAGECALLRARGHEVVEYIDDNRRIADLGVVASAVRTVWARDSYKRLSALLRQTPVDVAHFHNTWFLVSPSGYYACRAAGVPVVQTLHNYRLACPAAGFFRDGRPCEDCLGRLPWPGIVHRCYRQSRAQTALVAATVTSHRWAGTWRRAVSAYVACSEFQRRKLVAAGLPQDRLLVKPHFVAPDPGPRSGVGAYGVFVGRLAAEKGVRTLLAAWRSLPDVPLKLVGTGPLADEARAAVQRAGCTAVELVGELARPAVFAVLKAARFLVFPSEGYETFGMSIVEAFACGVPVLASRLGAMAELVADGRTGLHFAPGDASDLAATVRRAWDDPDASASLGLAARAEYEAKYTADRNYEMLLEIYVRAAAGFRRR